MCIHVQINLAYVMGDGGVGSIETSEKAAPPTVRNDWIKHSTPDGMSGASKPPYSPVNSAMAAVSP